jgi:acyl-CoA synthetase (AMP-forming)/AMP-acid ligase II/acyl carrier protein
MNLFNTEILLHTLREHARQRPKQTALIFLRDGEFDEVSLTYAELDARARAIAGRMLKAAPKAKRALLLHPPGLEFAAALCGCFYAGVAAVPCYPPSSKLSSRSGERFLRLVNNAEVDLALTDSANVSKIFLSLKQLSNVRLLATDKQEDNDDVAFPGVQADDIALIQYTSGSTGSPKGVMLSHANLSANLRAIQSSFGLNPSSRVVSWLPPYHDMGLIGGILAALACGYPLVMLEPRHFLQKPIRWLQAIARYRADTSGGPGFAYDLCASAITEEQRASLDLSCWGLAFCGAETVRAATLRRFSGAFAGAGFRQSALYPCYGLAEATLMATAVGRGDGARIVPLDSDALAAGLATPVQAMDDSANELVGCGKPGAGVSLRIVDPQTGQVCDTAKAGEIWLSGGSVAQGYWNLPDTSRETFKNMIDAEGDTAWLRTGDLGFLLDGELFVSGRLKDLIIIRGRNYHPPDLEETVCSSHPALALNACAVFAVEGNSGEQLVIAAEVRREARRDLDGMRVIRAIRATLSESFELSAQAVLLLKPGTLPRTTSGKISRSACREQYLAGDWTPIVSEDTQSTGALTNEIPVAGLEGNLFQRVASVLRIPADSLDGEQSLGELGLDSLKRVELAITLEQLLGRSLAPELFEPDLRLTDLLTLLQKTAKQERIDAVASDNPENEAFDKPGRELPLTPLQHAFLYAGTEAPETFVETVYLRTPRGLDVDTLRLALADLEARYDALRLRFHTDGAHWHQTYGTPGTGLVFERLDAAGLSAAEIRERRTVMVEHLQTGFDLAHGPLARAVLFDRGPAETGILGLAFHHLIIDVVSVSIFVTALQYAYADARSGLAAKRDADPAFGRWLLAMDAHAQGMAVRDEIGYWRGVCGIAGAPEPAAIGLDVPAKQPRWQTLAQPGLPPMENRQFLLRYPEPKQRHDVFLAALAHAWCQVSGEDHALVLLEQYGRQAFGGSAPLTAMGWFVCRYPVRIPCRCDLSQIGQVAMTQEIMHAVPGEGEGYGLLARVCRDPSMREAMNGLRRPRLKLIYRGGIDDGFRADALFPMIGSESSSRVYYDALERSGENCHLELYVSMTRGMLAWTLQYAPAFCDEAKAHALADEIGTFIQALAAVE